MDINKARLVSEDKNSYTVHHPEHGQFSVAKSGLDNKTHEYIKGMAYGGESEDDPSSYANENTAKTMENLATLNLLNKEKESEADAENKAAREEINYRAQNSAKGIGASDSWDIAPDARPLPTLPASAPTDDASARNPANSPYAPPIYQTQAGPQPQDLSPSGLLDTSYQQGNKASDLLESAKTKMGTEQASKLDSAVQLIKDAQARYQQNSIDYDASSKVFEDKLKNDTISVPNLLGEGVGNKILAAISIALGGIGQGLMKGGPNMALEVLKQASNDEIQRQQREMGRTKNLYSMNLEKFKNKQAAELATENQIMSIAKLQLDSATARAQTPMAQAANLQTKSALAQQYAQNKAAILGIQNSAVVGSGLTQIPNISNSMMDKETKESLVRVPISDEKGNTQIFYGKSLDPKRATELQDKITAYGESDAANKALYDALPKEGINAAGIFKHIPILNATEKADLMVKRDRAATAYAQTLSKAGVRPAMIDRALQLFPSGEDIFTPGGIAKLKAVMGSNASSKEQLLKTGIENFKGLPSFNPLQSGKK